MIVIIISSSNSSNVIIIISSGSSSSSSSAIYEHSPLETAPLGTRECELSLRYPWRRTEQRACTQVPSTRDDKTLNL